MSLETEIKELTKAIKEHTKTLKWAVEEDNKRQLEYMEWDNKHFFNSTPLTLKELNEDNM